MNFKLGLDTGGTYTDAVIVNDKTEVVAKAKSLTTHQNLSIGLRGAIDQVLLQADDLLASHWEGGKAISLVSLSTTLATNALVEGKGRRVALVLVGYTENQFKRARLSEALDGDPVGFIDGGHNAAGTEINPLDLAGLQAFVEQHRDDVEAFAVSAMFAVRNPEHENRARDLVRSISGKPVSCGHELSSALDAPRRALTAVLNARLIPLIKGLLDATADTLAEYSINAPVMVVKGDGSLVSTEFAQNSPVETILSGPAASVVGAKFLSGETDLIISDIGGTTTDIALLKNGMPKLDPAGATVGGWRTMVEAVLINTHGLGGDSQISFNRENRDFDVGPQRVKPLSRLIHEHPELLDVLTAQNDLGYVSTHAAQFALCNATHTEVAGLSAQQNELWQRIVRQPVSLVTLFEDQTLDRPLARLVNRGLVLMSGFTPTDACHILDWQNDWDASAARLAATMLMQYSEYNLGPVFDSVEAFAEYIVAKVARNTAMALLEATLADQADLPSLQLSYDELRFIDNTFARNDNAPVKLNVQLDLPVMGIGASAISYYPNVATMLNTRLELPEHGGVANALGAVVGSVRQILKLTITPAGGNRVRVHDETGPQEFEDLEQAADWCTNSLSERVRLLALEAGASECKVTVDRRDNQVENEGRMVFFESTITAQATGRPSTLNSDKQS